MHLHFLLYTLYFLLAQQAHAQTKNETFNQDESKVAPYSLPNILTSKTPEHWRTRGNDSNLNLFEHKIYGAIYQKQPYTSTTQLLNPTFEHGLGTLYQITITLSGSDTVQHTTADTVHTGHHLTHNLYLLLALPNNRPKAPVFLGLNFYGNESTTSDTSVPLSPAYMPWSKAAHTEGFRSSKATRGYHSRRWPYAAALKAGYAMATMYCGDMAPDDPKAWNSVIDRLHQLPYCVIEKRRGDRTGAIGLWALALRQCVSYLQTNPAINSNKIAVMGHSRLGKAALWAGATDERIALTISNNSGEMGAALARRNFGETLESVYTKFPYWFTPPLAKFAPHPDSLPTDQHQLLGFIAPRLLYIASASQDEYADPKGEYLALAEASKLYHFLGKGPVWSINDWPTPGSHRHKSPLGYHLRKGEHDMVESDWKLFFRFARSNGW